MLQSHFLQASMTSIDVGLPLYTAKVITNLNLLDNIGSFQNEALPIAALLAAKSYLPKLRNNLLATTVHDVQRKLTGDMVKSVYERDLDTKLGTPTGICAVLTSRNYGTVSNVIPTFYKDIAPVILETSAISLLLTSTFGLVGLSLIHI